MKKLITIAVASIVMLGFMTTTSNAKTLKCQTVINAKGDEARMLKRTLQNVTDLTGGSLKFELMPAGTVVGVKETLDAIDKGLIDCGFAWTHYWSGEHPAAMLFGSPVAGGGVGLGFYMVEAKNFTNNFGMKWEETLRDLWFNQWDLKHLVGSKNQLIVWMILENIVSELLQEYQVKHIMT